MASLIRQSLTGAVRRLLPGIYVDLKAGRYAREWVMPRHVPADDDFLPRSVLGHDGIDLRVADQLARLRGWEDERYQKLFRLLREDPAVNAGWRGEPAPAGSLHNGYYPTPDAEIYAAMILDAAPDQIVEVGSGYSTLVARHAIRYGGLKTKLTVIDPEPRTNVRDAADEVVTAMVEDSALATRSWTGKSLLFIDSSHVCRTGGDLPLLFCKVLPNLPAGMVVHVHDIFLPYDYPTNYHGLCYTEQYLLHCALSASKRYRTLMATHYLSRTQPAAMQRTFAPHVGVDPAYHGASYWFRVETDSASTAGAQPIS